MARGFAHDLNGALDYALGIKEEPAPATETGSAQEEAPTVALTPREEQVAALVAQGMSNKQIAAQLVVSPRTVEGHVEHILAKLGFTSRAHIAAWNVRQTGPLRRGPQTARWRPADRRRGGVSRQ
ncbi:helix-turn-helix transcriptional regulator [Streptomyces sp. NBC_00250]|uniref:response regulator transcription factor n=1 Tax=Streptomyces sp. NBC_00250 TaxID=2903641 RepID=UPI002E286048|nr:helix-turn-helix transcriptional regulator [Streptomyces sp. NBC_00250]